MSSPNVGFIHPELREQLYSWDKIRDCLSGERAIKAAGDKYLPRPNPEDTSTENKARYSSYLERAVFYNVTRRTLDGLVGQVYMRDPILNVPPALEFIEENIDGAGVTITQQSKKALSFVMSYGRAGLLIDYPAVTGPTSKADQDAGNIRPTILLFEPWDIINWRTTNVGARRLLSLVVLRGFFIVNDDGFEYSLKNEWRVLRLVNNVYVVEIWRDMVIGDTKDEQPGLYSTYIPQDSNGKPFSEIPFVMIGAMNNDESVDYPPIYDLATLNIAHYRNSADYEESSYLVGQPTPYFSGVTQNWVNEVWKGQVMLGSRSAIPLPEGGMAGLLQCNPNSMPYEAMQHKERQMVALGAKLVEQKNIQRTFGEAQLEEASETSILATAAKNVGHAYTAALKFASMFVGAGGLVDIEETTPGTEEAIEYELNTDFPAARMSDKERAQLVAEWQAGAIAYEEMRSQLRKAGVTSLTDEEAQQAAESDPIRKQVLEAKKAVPNNGSDNGRVSPAQNGKVT
jgi:hypothetical protein